MSTLQDRALAAGARMDGIAIADWLAHLPDGEARATRALAICGYPAALTEEAVAAVEAVADRIEAEREAQRIAEEEAAAWAEFGA